MKMSNEKFRVIVLPIVAIIVVLVIVLTMAANTYSAALDLAFGRGQRHVVDAGNVSEEAAEYYEALFPNPDAGTLENADPPTEIEEKSRNWAAETALKVTRNTLTLLFNTSAGPFCAVAVFVYLWVERGKGIPVGVPLSYILRKYKGNSAFYKCSPRKIYRSPRIF